MVSVFTSSSTTAHYTTKLSTDGLYPANYSHHTIRRATRQVVSTPHNDVCVQFAGCCFSGRMSLIEPSVLCGFRFYFSSSDFFFFFRSYPSELLNKKYHCILKLRFHASQFTTYERNYECTAFAFLVSLN